MAALRVAFWPPVNAPEFGTLIKGDSYNLDRKLAMSRSHAPPFALLFDVTINHFN